MRTVIFGGTFNPFHLGHLHMMERVASQNLADQLLVLPNQIPPHKTTTVSADHRVEMARLGIATFRTKNPESNLTVNLERCEIEREGPSYTADTVDQLHKAYPNLSLLIGEDSFFNFHLWHRPQRILEVANLIVVARYRTLDKSKYQAYWEDHFDPKSFQKVRYEDAPAVEISSTEIREYVRQGKDILGLVPGPIADYIFKNNLYVIP